MTFFTRVSRDSKGTINNKKNESTAFVKNPIIFSLFLEFWNFLIRGKKKDFNLSNR